MLQLWRRWSINKFSSIFKSKLIIKYAPIITNTTIFQWKSFNFWTSTKTNENKTIEDYEFTKFDLVPKQSFSLNDILHESDRDESNQKVKLNIYQSLIVEIVNHLKSENFNKEFSPFVKNQNTYINLLNLHIWLVTHGLLSNKYTPDKNMNAFKRTRTSYEIK